MLVCKLGIQIKHLLVINHKEVYFKIILYIQIVLPFIKDKGDEFF